VRRAQSPDRTGQREHADEPKAGCATATNLPLVPRLNSLARTHGVPANALVLACALRQPFPIFPVIGANMASQLADRRTALGVPFNPAELTASNAAKGFGLAF
jgi:aryl-alcohol dehydrogenase-like predicted oxidoreductase